MMQSGTREGTSEAAIAWDEWEAIDDRSAMANCNQAVWTICIRGARGHNNRQLLRLLPPLSMLTTVRSLSAGRDLPQDGHLSLLSS
ncbi:hypothetical protein BaRGS_00010464 [Batillaria attramentaria]|uniref:Uncharacterized protein n=1 Tax=Batillaria attramentaria TaxID=370345 RepID=A0ABD0LGX1_9CAEN